MPQIDMITRKKLMLKKYNNNLFSNQEFDFFSKINATQITVLLKQNPHLRTSQPFFQHLAIRQLQKIIASIFEPDEPFIQSEVFNILVNLLRNTTILLDICFKNAQFNYMSLFGFLEEEHVDYPVLILLEDVLLPFIRKSPFQVQNLLIQILELIMNDEFLEDIFLRRIYEKPVFKIMYTLVFCLSKKHSENHKEHITKIVHSLAHTPFDYISHKEKHLPQKISIIAMHKTQLTNQSNAKPQESSKNIPQIHTKKVREKHVFIGSVEDLKSLESLPKLKSQKSSGSTYKMRVQSESQESLSPPRRLRPQFSLQVSEPDELTPQQMRSITSIHRQKSIIFNEDLDFSDLTYNMRDLLSDITFNFKSVDLTNLVVLLESINETYISRLIQNCQRFIKNDEFEGYCQGSITIMIELGQLYKAAVKYMPQSQEAKNCEESSTNSQADGSLATILQKLQNLLQIVASKIPLLCTCILQSNEIKGVFPSGQKIKKIGLPKFKMLKLLHMLLQFSSKNRDQEFHQPKLNINFSNFDIFLIVQKCLTELKWNNLTHCVLIKLVRLCLEQDYANFKKRYIEHLEKPKDGILGTLIEIFRNKKFVFLKNMHFSNNGNVYAVYEISKLILQAVKTHGDYELLISKFPVFNEFVTKDLIVNEKLTQPSELEVHEDPSHSVDLIKNLGEKEEKHFKSTIESGEQMIQEIDNSKRWSSPLKSLERKLCL